MSKTRSLLSLSLGTLSFFGASRWGGAAEPRSAGEPRILVAPGEVTDVIDAFEDGDAFDINVSLGFEYSSRSAKILRETSIYAPGLSSGGYTSRLMNVARFSETTSKLVPRVDVGIYKDLALYLKLPIVLQSTRELTSLDGSDGREDVVLQGAPGEVLFDLPFRSPTRSGLLYVALGAETDIFNQSRDPSRPTWLLGVESRFSVGEPMHACNEGAAVRCADLSDINRNNGKDSEFEGNDIKEREPGITRGTTAIELHTMLSKRIKHVEPYGGFSALFEFANDSSDFGRTDFEGAITNNPPVVATMTLGTMIIPWENREKWSRVTLDLRFLGEFHSRGRDYSELFDALGSSSAASLRNPQYSRFKSNPAFDGVGCGDNDTATPCASRSVIDEGSERAYFSGLTEVEAYGSYRGSVSVSWQASEYVKFQLGFGYRHDQGHGISSDQPCNPDVKLDTSLSGPCHSGSDEVAPSKATGMPNPNYRPTINMVGRRFYVEDSDTIDVFASGVVMF